MADYDFIKYADRMNQLPPYLFGMINKMKMEKRRNGDDVIDLGMGNPTDPAPDIVTEKLREVATDPKSHRYPIAGGMKNLKRELALKYDRDYGVKLDRDSEVIFTIGSKEGISHLCLALLGHGDTAVVPSPFFPVHVYAAIIADAGVITLPFFSEEDFIEKLTDIYESHVKKPKLVMLNYPHNPTGRVVSMDFLVEIVRLAKKYDFMVVNDFAYGKIIFDGKKAPSFLEVPGASDVGVEFGSFSKSYNMAGWRIGYCVGNEKMIQGLEQIKGYYDYGIFSAIQIAGIIALKECDEDIVKQTAIYENRRNTLCDGLARIGWDAVKPESGMFAWIKIPEKYGVSGKVDSMKFAMRLMNEANVAVAPGAGFGKEGEGFLRLALVENEERIRQAVRQIGRVTSSA